MELAVVSHGSGAVHDVGAHGDIDGGPAEGLIARLLDGRWSAVHGAPAHRATVTDIARALAVPGVVDEHVDLARLITDNPGARIAAVATGTAIRELAAAVMEVDPAHVPVPQPLSLTRIQASRKGIRTVLCLNDTLHLLSEGSSPHG